MSDLARQELYNTIWNIADKLRGAIDGWDFKNYILGFLFYRYISKDFSDYVKDMAGEGDDFDYSTQSDDESWISKLQQDFIEEKGYFIPPSCLFNSLLRRINSSQDTIDNLNTELEQIFKTIVDSTRGTDSEKNFKGLFGLMDLNGDKLGAEVPQRNKKLKDIMMELSQLKLEFGKSKFDIFGDAYEYLIRMYASTAGKRGGEFYTPPEVSELLVNLVKENKSNGITKIYDPTCGSGSLLLKFIKNYPRSHELKFFGQEFNPTTYNLCRMNMFLHGINYSNFDIRDGDTLKHDAFKGMFFDVIVSNPPYSATWGGKDDPELRNDERFCAAGALAPKSKADFAFIQHSVSHLTSDGVAAIICFPGALSRTGTEEDIRKWLVEKNFVDAIIQLPENLFYGTGISTCIMILKKNKTDGRVMFINAESIFTKAIKKNRLSDENIERIMELYRKKEDVEELTKMVTVEEIRDRSHVLSVSAYVVKQSKQEKVDLQEINQKIDEIVERVHQLRKDTGHLVDLLKEGKILEPSKEETGN